ALEDALRAHVAIVNLGEDAVHVAAGEDLGDEGREGFGGQAPALAAPRQRHAQLGRPGLVGKDAYRAITAHTATLALADRQLEPLSRLAERRLTLRAKEALGIAIEYGLDQDW
ncbi:MAG TPA: hypothetical protein VG388_14170, partial [Solirubrobacteraceae bacterium]|nr:hypothetical protein [Solirubrobacteraceae bacterium]